MKKLFLSCLLASSVVPAALMADQMTGYISDAHCGAAHSSVSDANTKCVDTCMKKGSDPVFVMNGKVIKFDADSKDKAKSFAGQSVKIDGTMDGDMLKINSIDKAQ